MSLTVLFKTKKPSQVGSIVLDALISDNHEMENEVTEFPVESGAPVNDHIWAKPRRYTITGVVTNSPVIIFGAAARAVATASALPLEERQNALTNYDFVGKAFEALEEMHHKRDLIDVFTPLRAYRGYAIESIEIQRDQRTGASLPFTVRIKEVKRVSSQQVDFTVAKAPRSNKAAATAQTGKQTPTQPTNPRGVTLLKTLIRGGG